MSICQDDEDMEPKRSHLYVGRSIIEFREEVVQCILREMREDLGRKAVNTGNARFMDEIRYDKEKRHKEKANHAIPSQTLQSVNLWEAGIFSQFG